MHAGMEADGVPGHLSGARYAAQHDVGGSRPGEGAVQAHHVHRDVPVTGAAARADGVHKPDTCRDNTMYSTRTYTYC